MRKGRAWVGTVLRLAVGLTLLGWVLWRLDWAALAQSLRHIQVAWVLAAILSFLLSLALKLVRWRWLLAGLAPRIGWITVARALFIGQAVNIVGVGRLGEVARVVWLRRESGLSGVGLASSVVAEKIFDIAFLGLAGGMLLLVLVAPPEGLNVWSFILLSGASLLAIGLLGWQGESTLKWIHALLTARSTSASLWLAPRVASLADGLAGLTQRRQLGRGLLLSACIWVVMTLTNLLLLGAFALPLSSRLALSVIVIGHLGVAANLTPANIGPLHWAVTFALTLFGISRSAALAYAIVMHAIVTLVPLAIAFVLNGWQWPELKAAEGRV